MCSFSKRIDMFTKQIICLKLLFLFVSTLGSPLIAFAQVNDSSKVETFLYSKIPKSFGKSITKRLNTSATSTVSSDIFRKINTPTLGNTLIGQLPGLYLAQRGGAPGNNDFPLMSIRGRQTFQDNEVLVLVDGFESNWQNILPDEIESVSVLKDAAALAMYGMDGANNVLLITTKRGEQTYKTNIQFNTRIGLHSPVNSPDFLSNADFADLYNVALKSDGKNINNGLFKSDTIVNYFKTGQLPLLYPNVDWYKEVLKPNALSKDYSLTFSGGKADVNYFVAMGVADFEGLYANTQNKAIQNTNYNLRRYNLRANFDVDITSFLSATVGLRGTMSNKFLPNINENTLWRTMSLFKPYPVKTDDGSWGGTQGYPDNPVGSIQQKGYQIVNDRSVDANVKVIAKLDAILKGLQAFGQINFQNFFFDTYNKTRGFNYQELVPRPDLIVPGTTPVNEIPFDRIPRGNATNNFTITQGNGSQINRTNLLYGFELENKWAENTLYVSTMYFQELLRSNGVDASFAKQRIMGRASFTNKDKYLAEFSYAFAGSENFPKANRFGFFPALSLGWIMSNEHWISKNNDNTFFKLRGSIGLLGNDNVGNSGRFIFNQFYFGSGNYLVGNNLSVNEPTFTQGNLANPFVTWEKALRGNIGFEAVVLKNIYFSLDYFRESRKDIYINPANYVPTLLGATFNNVNKGEAQSEGGELEVKWQQKIFFISGHVSYAKNKIINVEEPLIPESYLYAKGNPINQPFVLESIGFFKDLTDIQNSPKQLFGNVFPGDLKYKDQNKDNIIDNRDRIPAGKTALPELWYSLQSGANYAGFDINLFIQGATGRTISLIENGNIIPFLNGGVLPVQWVKENYWTPTQGDAAKFPRLTTVQNDNNYRSSTFWQRSGAFLRLRNIEIGYTLPQIVVKKLKIYDFRIFIGGNNLLATDKINEMSLDPEIMNAFVHPAMKAFNVGFTLKL